MILIAVVGGFYYYRSKMITTKQKAGELSSNSYDNQKIVMLLVHQLNQMGKNILVNG